MSPSSNGDLENSYTRILQRALSFISILVKVVARLVLDTSFLKEVLGLAGVSGEHFDVLLFLLFLFLLFELLLD